MKNEYRKVHLTWNLSGGGSTTSIATIVEFLLVSLQIEANNLLHTIIIYITKIKKITHSTQLYKIKEKADVEWKEKN